MIFIIAVGESDFSFIHGLFRLESSKGTYAKEWVKWEKQLRDTLLNDTEYLNSIQVNIKLRLSLFCLEKKSLS